MSLSHGSHIIRIKKIFLSFGRKSPDDEDLRREGENVIMGDSGVVGTIPDYGEQEKGSEGEELSEDGNIQEEVVVGTIPCPVQIEGQVTGTRRN